MKRRAFISVYDKVGLIDFARNLTEKFEYEIVASSDTYELLKKADIPAQNLAEFAPIGSLMGQNFDALNSSVLSGVLANSSDTKELSEMEKMTIKPFDMVVLIFVRLTDWNLIRQMLRICLAKLILQELHC